MRIAITGASGLIGTALGVALREQGHDVRPVARGSSAGPEALRWDPAAGSIDAGGFEGIDAVVHLAGAPIGPRRWTAERKRQIHDSRAGGTDLLARTLAGLDRKPAVLVSASAIGYYGDHGDAELTETSPSGDDFLASVVRDWEAATQPARDAGIRTVMPRSGVVLSRHGGALPRMLPLFRLGLGGRMGSGRQWWSWISIDDEVGAISFLLGHDDLAGPINLTAPNPVTNAEFTRALGRALRRPTRLPVPAFGPRLVMGRELADALLFTSQRVRPEVLSNAGYAFRHPDIDTAFAAVLAKDS